MESIPLPDGFKDLLKTAKKNASTDWEKTFVTELAARHKKWGEELYVSEKQLAILQKIAGGEDEDAEEEEVDA